MEVTLPDAGQPIDVLITYWVLPDSGAAAVPLSALTPKSTGIISPSASVGLPSAGGATEEIPGFRLQEQRKHYWEGSVPIPGALGPEADSLPVHLSFSVEGGWGPEGRIEIPLLVPRWLPLDPTPRTFIARVEVPRDLTLVGSFPTSVLARPRPDGERAYEIGLQGVPSMLILEVVAGAGPVITLERGLDLLVILALLLMGALGVMHLRRGSP